MFVCPDICYIFTFIGKSETKNVMESETKNVTFLYHIIFIILMKFMGVEWECFWIFMGVEWGLMGVEWECFGIFMGVELEYVCAACVLRVYANRHKHLMTISQKLNL